MRKCNSRTGCSLSQDADVLQFVLLMGILASLNEPDHLAQSQQDESAASHFRELLDLRYQPNAVNVINLYCIMYLGFYKI